MDFKGIDEFIKIAFELISKNREFIVCTVIESIGSSPQKAGSKMIVVKGGEILGTVGGGRVESETINKAMWMLENRSEPFILRFDLQNIEIGVCGGNMSIYLEGYYSKRRVIIFGAGHIAEALCDLLKKLNYNITVFDNRKERLESLAFDGCEKICNDYTDLKTLKEKISYDTDVLIMTPNHEYDFLLTKNLLREHFRSIGVLGSKRKREELINFLKKEGFSEQEIAKIRIPVGLEIGSRTPYEIAVSICAELIQMSSSKR